MVDKAKFEEHIKTHHDGFPATKDKLIAACNNMSEFTDEEKKWFADTLPAGTYDSAEKVISALGL